MKNIRKALILITSLTASACTLSMDQAILTQQIVRSNQNEFVEELQKDNPSVAQIRYYLDSGIPADFKTEINGAVYTALMLAAEKGHTKICKLLLTEGANANGDSCSHYNLNINFNPLMLAAKRGHEDTCQLLIQHGADLDQKIFRVNPRKTAHYISSLALASESGHTKVVNVLLENGANPDSDSLILAVLGNHTETCRLLINAGGKVNETKGHGTPLHLASSLGHTEMCSLLLEHGASIAELSPDKLSALEYAAKANNPLTCKTLVTQALFFPRLSNVQQARNIIKTVYLCFNRVCPFLNQDIYRKILASSTDFREYITHLALFLYKQKRPFPLQFLPIIQEGLTNLRIEQLQPLADKAIALTSDDATQAALTHETIEKIYRDDIHQVSIKLLSHLPAQPASVESNNDYSAENDDHQWSLTGKEKFIVGSIIASVAYVFYRLWTKDLKDPSIESPSLHKGTSDHFFKE